MPIDETNLIRHELNGLEVTVSECLDPSKKGISGIIINETLKTITIRTKDKEKQVQKKECTFIIKIPSGIKVEVKGTLLYGRPEERIKKRLPKKWDVL